MKLKELEIVNENLDNRISELQSQVEQNNDTTIVKNLETECKVLKDMLQESKSLMNLKLNELEQQHAQKLLQVKQEYEMKLEKSLRMQIRMETEKEISPVIILIGCH